MVSAPVTKNQPADSPTISQWDRNIPGAHYIDLTPYAYGNGIANLLTDVLILVLPIPMVWGLTNVSTKRKTMLTGVFLLGAFVCAISAIRTTTIKSFSVRNPQWSGVGLGVWSELETCVGIVCACLPTLWPLLAYAFRHRVGRRGGKAASTSSSSAPAAAADGSGSDGFSNPANFRSSDYSLAGTGPQSDDRKETGRGVHQHFAHSDEDLELGEVKVGQGGKGWMVVKRVSVGAELDD